jgi:HEAT repeat protein
MYLYRGKDIKSRDELRDTCLDIIKRGSHSELYDILPHLRILRSPFFLEPLLELLRKGNTDQKAAAAMALGSLGDERAIEHLRDVFLGSAEDSDALKSAIIEALGELGSERAVEIIVELYRLDPSKDEVRPQRAHLAIAALGQLAQQGVVAAEEELLQLMTDTSEVVRIQAVTELSVAFWHRPNDIPERLLNKIQVLARENSPEVQMAAKAALSNLAQLGSEKAEQLLLKLQ